MKILSAYEKAINELNDAPARVDRAVCAAFKEYDAKIAALEAQVKTLERVEPEWVVNNLAELGVKIGERFFFLYKGENIVYSGKNEDGSSMTWRTVGKREFGECCHPINYKDPTLIGTVSPDDCDRWKPMPFFKKGV